MNRPIVVRMDVKCKHRGGSLGYQRCSGCGGRGKVAMVFECAKYGKAARRRVMIEGTRRPDHSVSVCLGCPDLEN